MILVDTNVVLDLLLARMPFGTEAKRLFGLVETGELQGMVAATTVTTVFYLARKALGANEAKDCVRGLLALFHVAPVTREVLARAAELDFADFEDAVIHESAVLAGARGIVTRDSAGFSSATLRIYSPSELLAALG
jgi:predicted nucleic acid-binding protein